jgi:septal ring factor EnvC (AmiA/AmiB activator)
MGAFNLALLEALLCVGVPHERARALVEILDKAIDERYSIHGQILATKRDVAEIQAKMAETRGQLEASLAQTRGQLEASLAQTRGQLEARIAQVEARVAESRGQVEARIAESRADVIRWTLAALTAQTALLLGAIRLF